MNYKLFTDGGARGNPGPAAIGAFLFDENDNLVDYIGKAIGFDSNNVAEYRGLIEGMKLANKNGVSSISCFLDSELVVKQLNKEYKVKDENLQKLFKEVNRLSNEIENISFEHVPREKNKFADRMVNIILDEIKTQ